MFTLSGPVRVRVIISFVVISRPNIFNIRARLTVLAINLGSRIR